jgi:hypothetical protein
MGGISTLYATQTPTPSVIPISDGSGTLDDWVTWHNPMTTEWDLIRGGVAGVPERLGVGSPGEVLSVKGDGTVAWEFPAVINILGTANEVTVTDGSGTFTISLPTLIIAPGSLETTTFVRVGTTLDVAGLVSLNQATFANPSVVTDTILHQISSDGHQNVTLYDSFSEESKIAFRRADGTSAAPSATQVDDVLAVINARGYGTTGYLPGSGAEILFVAHQSFTDSAQGTLIRFQVCPDGSTTRTNVMSLYGDAVLMQFPATVSLNSLAFPSLPAPLSGTVATFAQADGVQARVTIDSFGTASASGLTFRHSRGTAAAPSAVKTNDVLGTFNAFGYAASAYCATNRISLNFAAGEDWTNSAQGTLATFQVTPNGSTTPFSVATFTPNGLLVVGLVESTVGLVVRQNTLDPGLSGSSLRLIQADGTQNIVSADSAAATGLNIIGRVSGNTLTSPSATPAGSALVALSGRGWANGSYVGNAAQIIVSSVNLWSATDTSTQLIFNVTPSGSTTMGAAMIIDGAGAAITNGFGCNGKTAQAPYASGGLLAGVVTALIANGILSS